MTKPPVLVIAGGANSRFFPFQDIGHKGGFTLLGESLMVRTLRSLQDEGFTKVVCIITPKDAETQFSKQLVENANLTMNIQFMVQAQARGMGDAVMIGLSTLSDEEKTRFAVIAAYHLDAGKMLRQMLEMGDQTVVSAAETARPWEYGILTLDNSGLATDLIEKPTQGTEPSNQKILAVYVLNRSFADTLQQLPVAEYNFEIALADELHQHPAPVLIHNTGILSLKYPWQLFRFQDRLFAELKSYRATSAEITSTAVIDETKGPVYIGERVQIGHCTKIVGPCYLGDDVTIGDFSLVRGSTLERTTQVGCFTEIARSIIAEDVHIHSGYIGDSIIGCHTRVGAGFITANKRLDRRTVGVSVKGKVVDSEHKGLGALVGDNVKIGVHVSVMPGKCIGGKAIVRPHQSVETNITAAE
jgi:UDP-N-acetylglucosamine diphosphorylase / glucose-1-phosphate thymidylyltransferase / UDP-N-acetylgalactosamine diphosphorylase / glucosamine-1-phosphate N-acetyltransferase / galactosamine-1-phosphate N-acetyltransferase